MTKYLMLLFIFLAVIFFSSCGRGTANQTGERHDLPFAEAAVNYDYMRYSYVFVDLFDTVSRVIGYARSQEEFYYFSRDIIYAELYRLSKLFDGFNSHEGINNIKVINESAGIYPVEVHPDIIQMLHAGIDAYHKTNGAVNMAIGPVTSIWREYISRGEEVLPSLDKLQAAGALTSITDVIINEEKNTVFLRHAGMSLDVGSIGKGFAIEQAAQKAFDAGFSSFVLSVGGDVRLFGGPIGGSRDTWGIGVTDPFHPGEITEAIFAANTAVFTSGNYLRFYVVDGYGITI